jgi:integrase
MGAFDFKLEREDGSRADPPTLKVAVPNWARKRTIDSLRQRLGHATRAYGDVPLRDLERMVDELAGWRAKLPERSRYGIVGALRQTLGAAVRWDYMGRNPAKLVGPNRQPSPRPIRAYTLAEVDAIGAELSADYRPIPAFAAATGLRPEEWAVLERRDIDRRAGIVSVRRTVSEGEVVDLGKTSKSRRQVPLSRRGLAALDRLKLRIDTPLLFPSPRGEVLNLSNFRAANGRLRSRPPASQSPRGSTTCARPSPPTRSPQA